MTRTELVYSAERVVKSANALPTTPSERKLVEAINALWRVIQRLEPEATVNRTLSPR